MGIKQRPVGPYCFCFVGVGVTGSLSPSFVAKVKARRDKLVIPTTSSAIVPSGRSVAAVPALPLPRTAPADRRRRGDLPGLRPNLSWHLANM
jgi:hypothetical protein